MFVDIDRYGARASCMLCARGYELRRMAANGAAAEAVSSVFGPRRHVEVPRPPRFCPRCEAMLPSSAADASWLYCVACGPLSQQQA